MFVGETFYLSAIIFNGTLDNWRHFITLMQNPRKCNTAIKQRCLLIGTISLGGPAQPELWKGIADSIETAQQNLQDLKKSDIPQWRLSKQQSLFPQRSNEYLFFFFSLSPIWAWLCRSVCVCVKRNCMVQISMSRKWKGSIRSNVTGSTVIQSNESSARRSGGHAPETNYSRCNPLTACDATSDKTLHSSVAAILSVSWFKK